MTETVTVTVKVPAEAGHLALLRTAVGWVAGRDTFTIDQVDDLKMAVEEAGVQLLRHASGHPIQLDVATTETGVEARLHTEVTGDEAVIDENSFSFLILRALADDLRVEMAARVATIILRKHRIVLPEGSA